MTADAAFLNAGKKPGLEIWRIEKLKVVPVPVSTYGKFYTGDSYIVLSTIKNQNALNWDIHFWLGAETSQDEAGVAAYKTVELDDHLGGAPIQHREVQGHESQPFVNLFKDKGGLQYLEGGIESGFKKVERDVYAKRLLHVKGKRHVRVMPVEVSYKSLNKGDCFILDAGLTLYLWNGVGASRSERIKAAEVVRQIKDQERGGRANVHIIEDERDDDTAFFEELGGKGPVAPAKDDDDVPVGKSALYHLSDASGNLTFNKVSEGPFKKDDLNGDDVFILQTPAELYVWVGKKASKDEKAQAFNYAAKLVEDLKLPAWIPVTRVIEGGETTLFIQQFVSWPNPQKSTNFSAAKKPAPKAVNVDFSKLSLAGQKEDSSMVDDGSGKLEVWRVENFQKVPVDEKHYGKFFSGDSYVLLYSYKDRTGKDAWVIYFWQGNDSSQDEKGAAALLAVELDDSYGGAPVQVRVVQNKEPDHFLALFKGKFTIFKGGVGSGFSSASEGDGDIDNVNKVTRLFQVNGSNAINTKATEVTLSATSLNSNDSFVLNTPTAAYVWLGKFSTGDEHAVAKNVAASLHGGSYETVPEGSEKADFWELLGGQADYHKTKAEAVEGFSPRLFQLSNASGAFTCEEIYDFAQEDLIEDDIMLLDTYNEVYLWIGQGSNDDEKKAAYKTAIEFLDNHAQGRNSETVPIYTVKQGFEPPFFTANFVGWDAEKAKANVNNYEDLKASLMASNATLSTAQDELKKFSATYTYQKLTERPLPEGVDATMLENHLNPDEFEGVFGMTRDAFDSLPKWKRDNVKKAKKLF